jgi:hypothetical protein
MSLTPVLYNVTEDTPPYGEEHPLKSTSHARTFKPLPCRVAEIKCGNFFRSFGKTFRTPREAVWSKDSALKITCAMQQKSLDFMKKAAKIDSYCGAPFHSENMCCKKNLATNPF